MAKQKKKSLAQKAASLSKKNKTIFVANKKIIPPTPLNKNLSKRCIKYHLIIFYLMFLSNRLSLLRYSLFLFYLKMI